MIDKSQVRAYLRMKKPSLAGRFLYYCLPYRKRVVLTNMRLVFQEVLTEEEIKKLAQCFYSHAATSFKEAVRMRFMSLSRLASKVDVIGKDYALAAAEKNKGLIIITGHFGNWEYAPIAAVYQLPQFRGRFYFIRRPIHFAPLKFIERLLFARYQRAGLKVILKKNALDKVCDALENQDAVVFVMDQSANLKNRDGIAVEFLGHLSGTYRSPATIARTCGSPVVPAYSYRKPNGQHVLQFLPPLEWMHDDNVKQALYNNTLAYNQALASMLLQHPEQWLWTHKRWKQDAYGSNLYSRRKNA